MQFSREYEAFLACSQGPGEVGRRPLGTGIAYKVPIQKCLFSREYARGVKKKGHCQFFS
jgi:hypothetical protein